MLYLDAKLWPEGICLIHQKRVYVFLSNLGQTNDVFIDSWVSITRCVSKSIHFHMGSKVLVPLIWVFSHQRGVPNFMNPCISELNYLIISKGQRRLLSLNNYGRDQKKVITFTILFLQTCTKLRWRRQCQHQHIFCYNEEVDRYIKYNCDYQMTILSKQ